MSAYLFRRRNLGRTSCRELSRFSETGIQIVRNFLDRVPDRADYIFRWGCTSNVGDGTIVNSAEAIHRVSDKRGFRLIMDEHDLCPRTFVAGQNVTQNLDFTYPLVVRPGMHHQGRKLFVVNNEAEFTAAAGRCGADWYASPLINKVAEYRVFVVSGRAVCVAKKYPGNPEDVAWNVARGGRFENVRWQDWPLKAVKTSIQAFLLSGLDFGGVDVMIGPEGECFVLEINAAPSLTSPYRQKCFAKAFDYIVRNGKDVIPLQEARGGWKKFIHPSVLTLPQAGA